MYTLLQAFQPIVETLLSLWLRYLQSFLNAPNVGFLFYFLRTGSKRCHSVRSQHNSVDDLSILIICVLKSAKRARIVERSAFGDWQLWKHPYCRLLFTFGHIHVNPRFITCLNGIDVFQSNVIIFFFFNSRLIETSFFLSDWKIVWNSTWTIFFTIKCSCNIECKNMVPLIPIIILIAR